MIDMHTHTRHSFDSQADPETMAAAAYAQGCRALAFTNHYDRDIVGLPAFDQTTPLDLDATFGDLTALQARWEGRMSVSVGLECGWASDRERDYADAIAQYPCDFVLNSVHLVDGVDCYQPEFFQNRTKKQAYTAYLSAIDRSLDAQFPFDAIAHIGYAMRKAPYGDNSMPYSDYGDLLDDILRKIAERGKALEVNSNAKNTGMDFLPSAEILKRYRAMGGELLTFGSDAHLPARVCEKYELVAQTLKSLGFRYVFSYRARKSTAHKL